VNEWVILAKLIKEWKECNSCNVNWNERMEWMTMSTSIRREPLGSLFVSTNLHEESETLWGNESYV